MKKRMLALAILLMVGLWTQPVQATTAAIEIEFRIGEETLNINGMDVAVEKPFVQNGTTLVPLRVITEAFGADVTWDGDDQSIVLSYEDTRIKVYIGSKKAMVNDYEVTLTEAPVIVNGNSMVPLRFISENFGADVAYDATSKTVSIFKEIGEITSLENMGTVGDSYYGWTVSLPQNAELYYRYSDGSYTYYEAYDYSYTLEITVTESTDTPLDLLLASEIQDSYYYDITGYGVETLGDETVAKLLYNDGYYSYEERIYLLDGHECYVTLMVTEEEDYESNGYYQLLMDSFTTAFNENAGTEDLNVRVHELYSLYTDSYLGLSLWYPNDWYEAYDNYDANVINFETLDYDDYEYYDLTLEMFNLEADTSLDSWVEKVMAYNEETWNPESYEILEEADLTVADMAAKKIVTKRSSGGIDKVYVDIYFAGEAYKYHFSYSAAPVIYGLTSCQEEIAAIVESIRVDEPAKGTVGPFADKVMLAGQWVSYEDYYYVWTIDIPAAWEEYISWSYASFNNDAYTISVELESYYMEEGESIEDWVTSYKEDIAEGLEGLDYEVAEDIMKDKDTIIYQLNYVFNDTYEDSRYTLKLFEKDGMAYTYISYITDEVASEKNLEVLEDIWDSLEFAEQ